MGKASRRKHAAEQQRLYFDIKGDARNAEDRAQARVMLDKLQKKLDDDALREDGFYFVDGKYVDARRARFTPGMKTQSYAGHTRKITAVAIVAMDETDDMNDSNSWVVTFATESVCVWNMKTGEQLGSLDLSSRFAIHVCGAATSRRLPPAAMARDRLWVAFATHQQPTALVFDLVTRQFSSETASCSTIVTTTENLSVGHQQQITSVAFQSYPQLATCSMDSTCVLWEIDDHHTTRLGLTMLLMVPGADAGLTSCVFTFDNRELLTVGRDGTIKVWDLIQSDLQQPTSALLHQQHKQWNEAEPYSLSVAHTLDLLLFDDTLPSFHANDDWVNHRHRRSYGKTDALAMPSVLPQPVETPQAHKVAETTSPDPETVVDRVISEEPISHIEKLRREYEKIERFDFEMLLNPAASVLCPSHGRDNQSPLHYEQPRDTRSIQWPVLTPDANGRLLRCFQSCKANGDFAGHTSTVSGCAVAKESDLVVTVSYDKSVICWSFGHELVVSITRDAHTAAITSCALTCPTTSQPRDLELLLATAAKDNLIKVWRVGSAESRELQCVYTLTGHYDAITSLRFDASGVFLVSCSDDTLAHCWRVRPAPPDAPPKPLVLHVDKFAITIQWSVPLANGSALTKYVVHTQQLTSFAEDGIDLKTINGRDVGAKYTSIVVDDLQPGIQYRLCVAAVNAVGQSVWSETTDAVETLAFAPSKVDRAVQYREITPNSVRLSWKPPCANGASIRSYMVRCVPENAMFVPLYELQIPVHELLVAVAPEPADTKRRAVATKGKATPQVKKKTPVKRITAPPIYEYVVHTLWPGEVYQFVVAAENRCGLGAFSPVSDYIKMESTAPDAPTQPVITHVGKRFAEIAWVKPRSNGSEILQYIVEWSSQLQSAESESESESDPVPERRSVTLLTKTLLGTTYRIDGLQPGRPLCVWVAATNLVHGKLSASPFSPPSELLSTLCDVPDQPTKPQLLFPTAHSLVMAIHAPCDNGAAIREYQIALFCEEIQFGIVSKRLEREFLLRPEQFEIRQVELVAPPQMSFAVFKLRARTFYSATVVAVNDLGSSPVSDISIAVTTKPPTVPAMICDPPRIKDIEPTRAHISWEMSMHDGGAPLASFVLQYSINGGACDNEIILFQGRELLLEQLKPNTSYTFRVAATNGVGRAAWSPLCNAFTTPSLVEFTIATYFASRPALEHAKATVLQRRYRLWKRRTHDRDKFMEQLTKLLAASWHLL